jgi:hypothetical protein
VRARAIRIYRQEGAIAGGLCCWHCCRSPNDRRGAFFQITKIMAEREGFEPSVQVLARTTV